MFSARLVVLNAMWRFGSLLCVVFGSLTLTACGGGDAPALADSSLHTREAPLSSPLRSRLAAAPAITLENDALFDWAEAHYPEYFPSHQTTQSWGRYVYRFYPESASYLAVTDGTAVQVLGPSFGADILTVGSKSDYACLVLPQACTPVANAGVAQAADIGSLVHLSALASADPNGLALSYTWSLSGKPISSNALLEGANSSGPTFVPDVAGTYTLTVTVSNGTYSASATTTVTVAAASKLELYSISDSFFGGGATLMTWPYANSASVNASSTCVGSGCPTDYAVASFRLNATGASYTIVDVATANLTSGSAIHPTFGGLSEGTVVPAGQAVSFTVRSPFTHSSTVSLRYTFKVKETGQLFSYAVQLRTN